MKSSPLEPAKRASVWQPTAQAVGSERAESKPAKRATEDAAGFLSPASRACSACRGPFPRLTPWANRLAPASRAHAGPLRGLSGQFVRTCYVRIRVKDKRRMFPVTFLSRTRGPGRIRQYRWAIGHKPEVPIENVTFASLARVRAAVTVEPHLDRSCSRSASRFRGESAS